MLRKLLKYEIKATARTLLPLYGVLLIFAAISKIMIEVSPNSWNAPQAISMFAYISVLVGTMVMTFIVMIQRFYKNLLSDEGYLTFTLPTAPWKHIVSKLMISMMWMIASGIIAVMSIFIFAINEIPFNDLVRGFTELWEHFGQYFDTSVFLMLVEFLLFAVIALASGILIIYASIAIGHLASQHKVLASLGAFIVLNTLSQILFAVSGSIPFITHFFTIAEYRTPDFIATIDASTHFALGFGIIFFAILSTLYFVITNAILSKRLNLE